MWNFMVQSLQGVKQPTPKYKEPKPPGMSLADRGRLGVQAMKRKKEDTRNQIVQYLQEHGACTAHEIAAGVGISVRHTFDHCYALSDERRIKAQTDEERNGRRRLWWV